MKQALEDVAAYERGEAVNLRVTHSPPRPKQTSAKEIRHIRKSLKARQETLRHLSEQEHERGAELGARHAAHAAGSAETPDDCQEESKGTPSGVTSPDEQCQKTLELPCAVEMGRPGVRPTALMQVLS